MSLILRAQHEQFFLLLLKTNCSAVQCIIASCACCSTLYCANVIENNNRETNSLRVEDSCPKFGGRPHIYTFSVTWPWIHVVLKFLWCRFSILWSMPWLCKIVRSQEKSVIFLTQATEKAKIPLYRFEMWSLVIKQQLQLLFAFFLKKKNVLHSQVLRHFTQYRFEWNGILLWISIGN